MLEIISDYTLGGLVVGGLIAYALALFAIFSA